MKLLIIDPTMSVRSPSMKGIVRSLPHLKAKGWHIEVWCWECDDDLPIDTLIKLPRLGNIHTLGLYAFALHARFRDWWHYKIKGQPRPDVVYTVASYLTHCDIAHLHFSPWDWQLRQRSLGITSLRDLYERLTNTLSLVWNTHFLRHTSARLLLSVSESVAKDAAKINPALPIHILPNSYDPERFNSSVRSAHRDTTRAQLGYAPEHVVFNFTSAGHYRRKGFFLAAQAIAQLHASGHTNARLLVVGGTPSRLNELRAQLARSLPQWPAFIHFTGMVPDVERYFAASDALLFPSYSEAFALVEVEAAACGLPLFLTPHHGSEMILEDGLNGRTLEFDAQAIARVLAEFIEDKWQPSPCPLRHALDASAYADRLHEELLHALQLRVA